MDYFYWDDIFGGRREPSAPGSEPRIEDDAKPEAGMERISVIISLSPRAAAAAAARE